MPDRRQPATHSYVPIIAVCISAISLILGPCFGASVAVVGTYVTLQSKSAVTEKSIGDLTGEMRGVRDSVDKLREQVSEERNGNTELKATVAQQVKRIDEVNGKIEALQAHDTTQEKQYSEILGALRAKK